MIIAKETSISRAWFVYHKSLGNSYYLNLNTTGAAATPNTGRLEVNGNDTFICGTDGTNQIAYCFAEVDGYSKFGSYTGNGSSDGTFVYTGFRPAFVMTKNTNGTSANWHIYDSKRNQYNVIGEQLYANLSNAGADATDLDFTSNGFKWRRDVAGGNANGTTYIYMAFAEDPFKYSNAR